MFRPVATCIITASAHVLIVGAIICCFVFLFCVCARVRVCMCSDSLRAAATVITDMSITSHSAAELLNKADITLRSIVEAAVAVSVFVFLVYFVF